MLAFGGLMIGVFLKFGNDVQQVLEATHSTGTSVSINATILAAIIAATVSILVFLLKQAIDLLQKRSERRALEKSRLLIPLLYELNALHEIIHSKSYEDILTLIRQYKDTSLPHKNNIADIEFIIKHLGMIRKIVKGELRRVCCFGTDKMVMELVQWQFQLMVVEGYLQGGFDYENLRRICVLVDADKILELRKSVEKRLGLNGIGVENE
jgi:hypothetical protein